LLRIFLSFNLSESDKDFYKFLLTVLKIRPNNLSIYKKAFTHKSFPRSLSDDYSNNERLEFLGDAILDSVVAEYLYIAYPKRDEGFLTNMRSKIVNRKSLDLIGEKLGFEKFIKYSYPEKQPKHFFGNVLEALIGAMYVDKGYKRTKLFILNQIVKKFFDIKGLEKIDDNYKSQLLELCQKQKLTLVFETTENKQDNKTLTFVAKVIIDNVFYGEGVGCSKKEAEQNAAYQALQKISA